MKFTFDRVIQHATVFLVIISLGLSLFVVGTVGSSTSSKVILSPDNETVDTGDEVTIDIVVDPVSGGVNSYEFDASVDSETAKISNVDLVGTSGEDTLTSVDYGAENASISVAAGNADHTNGTIASITVTMENPGNASVSLSNVAVGDADANSYDIEGTEGASITATTPSVDVAISPVLKAVPAEGPAEVDLMVSGAKSGIGSYEFVATVQNTSKVTIENVTLVGANKTDSLSEVSQTNGEDISVAVASANVTGDKIATIRVNGTAPGNTSLALSNVTVGNENATYSYTISSAEGANLRVETPPTQVTGNDPSDTDGDGTYDDVNGDDEFNVVDVQALFQNYDSEAIKEHELFYDFNGDGEVNITDVFALYQSALS